MGHSVWLQPGNAILFPKISVEGYVGSRLDPKEFGKFEGTGYDTKDLPRAIDFIKTVLRDNVVTDIRSVLGQFNRRLNISKRAPLPKHFDGEDRNLNHEFVRSHFERMLMKKVKKDKTWGELGAQIVTFCFYRYTPSFSYTSEEGPS